ncbi:MAG: phage portal protein [Sporolactobacillus sp.]
MFFQSRREARERSIGNGSNQISLALIDGKLTPIIDGHISAERAIYNSDIFSCINLISADVAAATFKIRNGQDDQLLRVLNHPNRVVNGFSFWQAVLALLLLNGNAYCVIYRSRFDDSPVKLELLKNEWVDILQSDDGQELYYDITFAEDERSPIRVDSTQMLHFRLMSRDGGLTGISPLLALRSEITLQEQTNKLSLSAMTSAINPNGILTLDKALLSEKAKENIRQEFEKSNSGENRGRLMIVDKTMTFTPTSIDAQVLKVLQQTDWTRKQIAKAFAVPMDMLNQESEHSNIDQIRNLYATCLSRYTNPITSEVTNKLCRGGQSVMLDISSIVDPDYSQLETRMYNAVNNGLYTADEAKGIIAEAKGE